LDSEELVEEFRHTVSFTGTDEVFRIVEGGEERTIVVEGKGAEVGS